MWFVVKNPWNHFFFHAQQELRWSHDHNTGRFPARRHFKSKVGAEAQLIKVSPESFFKMFQFALKSR